MHELGFLYLSVGSTGLRYPGGMYQAGLITALGILLYIPPQAPTEINLRTDGCITQFRQDHRRRMFGMDQVHPLLHRLVIFWKLLTRYRICGKHSAGPAELSPPDHVL